MPAKKKSSAAQGQKSKALKTVNAKHKIEYEAPTLVDDPSIAETSEEAEDLDGLVEFEDDEIEVKRPPTVKQRLKAKFEAKGIGASEQLVLRIDRLPFFEQNGMAGVKTDREFCGTLTCTDEFFDNDKYLIEIQRRYGPGEYWLTIRHKNTIIQQWRERLGGFAMPVATQATGADGQPTTIIYQQPGQPAQPQHMPPADPFGEMRKMAKVIREFREDFGFAAPQAPAPTLDPEVIFLQGLASNDKFMDRIQNSAIKKMLGDNAVDDDPSLASVAMEMVKTGQADKAISAIGEIFLRIVDRIVPQWGVTNGQPPMATQTVQNQGQPDGGQVVPLSSVQAGTPPAALPQGNASAAGRQVDGRSPAPNAAPSQTAPPQQGAPTLMQIVQRLPINHAMQIVVNGQASANDITLAKVIDACARKVSPEGLIDWVFQFADELNAQLPDHSIDDQIELFSTATVDQILAFVGALPGGDQVVALPHAREWTAELQRIMAEAQQDEGEAEQ